MSRKETRKFLLSVEGINCETLYFEHLAELVNNSGGNMYNLKVLIKPMSPLEFAKRNYHLPVDKHNGKKLPYIHIQDVEDYSDPFHRKRFRAVIDEMRDAEENFHVSYRLGYSNYTFELWMLLHMTDMNYSLPDRRAYLPKINQWFQRTYGSLDDFKQKDAFNGILNQYITLDSVVQAIERAERIVQENADHGRVRENYRGVRFYQDNPDTSVHKIVRMMLDVCGVRY